MAGDAQKLFTLRIVWGALLMGQLLFAGVATMVRGRTAPTTDPQLLTVLMMVAAAVLFMGAVAAFILRVIMLRVTPMTWERYNTATIVHLALLEGPSLFGLVCYLLGASAFPILLIPAVAMVLQIAGFPRGLRESKDPFRIE